jgi:hypothetical protein
MSSSTMAVSMLVGASADVNPLQKYDASLSDSLFQAKTFIFEIPDPQSAKSLIVIVFHIGLYIMRILGLSACAVSVSAAGAMTVKDFKIACYNNQIAWARQWMDEGNNVDHPINDLGDTCLMVAARYDFVDLLTVLLRFGANVNAVDIQGTTALMTATTWARESLGTVAALIRASADVNHVQTSETPFVHHSNALSIAMDLENYEAVRMLIDSGAVVTDWMMLCPRLDETLTACSEEMKKFLLQIIEPKQYLVSREVHALFVKDAARRGETELLRLLLEARPDIDLRAIEEQSVRSDQGLPETKRARYRIYQERRILTEI